MTPAMRVCARVRVHAGVCMCVCVLSSGGNTSTTQGYVLGSALLDSMQD